MEAFFDFLAASQLAFIGIIGTSVVLAGLFFSRKIIKSKKWGRVAGVLTALVPIVIFSIMVSGAYGGAVEFIAMKSNGKELALMETHQVGNDEDGNMPTTVYRLYVVDGSNGKRLVRQLSDFSELIGISNEGVMIFVNSGILVYDLHTGEEIKSWTKYGGFESFPELSSGINMLRRSVDFQNRPTDYLSITANDGREYYFDVQHQKLYPGSNPPGRYVPTERFSFQTETGKVQKLVRHGNSAMRTFSGTFLKPEIVAQNDNERFIVVRHYTTLDEDNAVLTAISYDLQQLWQLDQKTLEIYSGLDLVLYTDNRIYATFGGTVVCVNVASGELLWKAKL